MIDKDAKLGKNVKIFDPKLVNIFGCEIGDGTFVGPFVEITRGVKIGKKCTIESHSFICDGVEIEDEVFIGHGVTFTNDSYPRSRKQVNHHKTLIKKKASIGSNAAIIGGVSIGRYALIGAGSVVTKDVGDFWIVAGNPARPLKKFKKLSDLANYIKWREKIRI